MSKQAKEILEAVAKNASKVMKKADEVVPPQGNNFCPNCGHDQTIGHKLDQPDADQE